MIEDSGQLKAITSVVVIIGSIDWSLTFQMNICNLLISGKAGNGKTVIVSVSPPLLKQTVSVGKSSKANTPVKERPFIALSHNAAARS